MGSGAEEIYLTIFPENKLQLMCLCRDQGPCSPHLIVRRIINGIYLELKSVPCISKLEDQKQAQAPKLGSLAVRQQSHPS
jgi:hypothetical protein